MYDRINRRVDIMIENGLVDEAKKMLSLTATTAKQAIGHKELSPYLSGEISLDDATENIKRATRRYAKRQLTWFHRNEEINWFYNDCFESKEALYQAAFDKISGFLEEQ